MEQSSKFEMTTEGYEQAKEYLKEIGAWNTKTQAMDGYSLVLYANDLYESPRSGKRVTAGDIKRRR